MEERKMTSFELMRVTRNTLNPIGKLIYDYFRKTENRRVCLTNALDAQDCFLTIQEAKSWITRHSAQ